MNWLVFSFSLLFSLNLFAQLDQPNSQRAWASFRDMSVSSYYNKLNLYKAKGYRPVDVEIQGGLKRTYAVVFRKNTENYAWAIHTKLTSSQYGNKWKELRDKGYRVIDQESYKLGFKRYYAGIWIKDGRSFISYRDMSETSFNSKFNSFKKNYLPIDIDVYRSGTKLKYAFVWVRNTGNIKWVLQKNLSSSSFSTYFNIYNKLGYTLYDLSVYKKGLSQRYATIWVKRSGAWKARRDMSSSSFANYWREYKDAGYRLAQIETYKNNLGVKRYAGIWVGNNFDRLYWSKKSEVDNEIKEFVSGKYRGASVAIMHKGKVRFLKGYGYADKLKNKKAHSGTVFRLASISKAVTGTLGFLLRDRYGFDIEKDIRSFLPGLPKHHKYRTEELLSNRSGVRHYKTLDPVYFAGQVSSAWSATKLFMKDPLVDQSYEYSTHGYTVFAAAVESEMNRSFCNQLSRSISNRHGLSSLGCENRKLSNSERSKVYTKVGRLFLPTIADNLSWKYAGGGMEADAIDMMYFLRKLDLNQILSRHSVEEMTTKPDNSAYYAFGWDVGTTDGKWKWYAKSGAQRGSRTYMRTFPDEDLHIVVLSNTNTSSPRSLVVELARIILD